jgi:hypothetical protein
MPNRNRWGLAWLLFACACAAFAASGDEAAIRQVFSEYHAALAGKDGAKAARKVTSATIANYGKMKTAALESSAQQVRALSFVDRLMVLRLRSEFTPQALSRMSPEQLFAHGVAQGWVGQNQTDNALGAIAIKGDQASAEALVNGEVTPFRFLFQNERGWRLDLVTLMASVNPAMASAAREAGMTEDAFIVHVLEQVGGKKLPDGIWDPPAKPARKP